MSRIVQNIASRRPTYPTPASAANFSAHAPEKPAILQTKQLIDFLTPSTRSFEQ